MVETIQRNHKCTPNTFKATAFTPWVCLVAVTPFSCSTKHSSTHTHAEVMRKRREMAGTLYHQLHLAINFRDIQSFFPVQWHSAPSECFYQILQFDPHLVVMQQMESAISQQQSQPAVLLCHSLSLFLSD